MHTCTFGQLLKTKQIFPDYRATRQVRVGFRLWAPPACSVSSILAEALLDGAAEVT